MRVRLQPVPDLPGEGPGCQRCAGLPGRDLHGGRREPVARQVWLDRWVVFAAVVLVQ